MFDAGHFREFAGGFTGTCGQTATSIAVAAAEGRRATQADMLALTRAMVANGTAAADGACTLASLGRMVRGRGLAVVKEIDWSSGQEPTGWVEDLRSMAGIMPIVLQLSLAYNLRDVVTGSADESGVHQHFIAVLGKQMNGYICADGDNPEADARYQIYGLPTLMAASPDAIMIIKPQETAPMTIPTVASAGQVLPQGCVDDGTTVRGNGYTITGLIREHWLQDPNKYEAPLEEEHHISATNTEQLFYNGLLGTVIENGVVRVIEGGAGQRAQELRAQMTALANQQTGIIHDLQVQVSTMTGQIGSLQQQLASEIAASATKPDAHTVAVGALVAALKELMA